MGRGNSAVKHKIRYKYKEQTVEHEIAYIPLRYIAAVTIAFLKILAILAVVVALCYHSQFFYALALLAQAACVVKIIASDDNPDYKVPWLLFVVAVPVVGFMLYTMFYTRSLKKKYIKRLDDMKNITYEKDDSLLFRKLESESPSAASQARMLCRIAETHLFTDTKQTYLPSGEEMHQILLADLEKAEKFIYMEYYIIEEGEFWDSVLEVLKRKAASGVEVKLIYDDIGCLTKLPGNYYRVLRSYGIDAAVFSYLRGDATREFNNRSHRKITVIDGKVGYTGGINLADEYINKRSKLGHFKDIALRLEGEAVWELTRLFVIDFGISVADMPKIRDGVFPKQNLSASGYMIPFGDGPRPIYERCVGKSVIQNLLNSATRYVYMTTPYLIIDNELCQSIENAALRGVDVRIILPRVPDNRVVAGMGRSYYKRLMDAGVRIYEYEPGFIHGKSYLADGESALVGTINLDYRSLVHNFENGVWMYRCESLKALENDIKETIALSCEIKPEMLKVNLFRRFIRAVVRIFSPML